MKSGTMQIYPDQKDRLGEKLRQAGKAREDQWAAERDRELLADMTRKQLEHHSRRKHVQLPHVFTRILCPIDFGESSLKALDFATTLAMHHGAMLYLLHVSQPDVDQWHEAPVASGASSVDTATARLRGLVAKRLDGLRHHCFVAVGSPADKIVQVSHDIGADLVVFGGPARSSLSRLLLGSLTERVLEKSGCSVLVARGTARQHWKR